MNELKNLRHDAWYTNHSITKNSFVLTGIFFFGTLINIRASLAMLDLDS